MVVGTPVGPLYSLDMFGLCNGRAQTVRCSETLDECAVMSDRVLARERKALGAGSDAKYFSVSMEPSYSRIDRNKSFLVDHGATNEVTKFDDVCNGLNHGTGNVPRNGGEIDLLGEYNL